MITIVAITLLALLVEGIPIPSPRYGVFIDSIRTLQNNTNLLFATVAFYNDPSLYDERNYSPVYNHQWNPIHWSYAMIHVDTGHVTKVKEEEEESKASIIDEVFDLTPIPIPVMDSMAGYALRVNGTVANLLLNNNIKFDGEKKNSKMNDDEILSNNGTSLEVVYSINFSNYIDTEVVMRELEDAGGGRSLLSNYPTICFVSSKLKLAYILYPECVDIRMNHCRRFVTRVAIIDTINKKLSTTNDDNVLSLSEESSGLRLPWDLLIYDDLVGKSYTVYDDLQFVLLPNDPYSGNSPLYVYFHETGLQTISSGSYYFPFSNISQSIVYNNNNDDNNVEAVSSWNTTTPTTVWEIRHKYTFVELNNSYWDAIVPYGYELIEKDMTGTVVRRVVLNPNDIQAVVVQPKPPTVLQTDDDKITSSAATKYYY